VDAGHFDDAKINTAAAGEFHSAVVKEDGALYTWGAANDPEASEDVEDEADQVPSGLGYADMLDKHVPMHVAPHHMQDARVGRCHSLPPQHALAFAMGTHALGSAEAEAAAPAGGSRRSKRLQGKAAGADKNKRLCACDDAGRSGEAGGGDVQVVAERVGRGAGGCGAADGGGQEEGRDVAKKTVSLILK
jgi:hypothetical protein